MNDLSNEQPTIDVRHSEVHDDHFEPSAQRLHIEHTDYLSRQNVKLRQIVGLYMHRAAKHEDVFSDLELKLAMPASVDYDALGNTRVRVES